MGDEEHMEQLGELIQDTVKWATRKYGLRAGGVVSPEDIEQEIWAAALAKLDKIEPRLGAGERGYVARILQNSAHDAMGPQWVHESESGGTLEDVEAGIGARPRMSASKNPAPAPVKIQRTAAKAAERALGRAQQERAVALRVAAVMPTLDATDAEILRLYLGTWLGPGDKPAAIALQVGLSEKTVYRRLAAIKERLRNPVPDENAEPLNIREG